MKKTYYLFLFLTSCVPYGVQQSFNIEDSKKMGVFVAEYKPKNSIVEINSVVTLDIKEIWLEYEWGYDANGSGVFHKNDKRRYLYILLNKKVEALKGLGLLADLKEFNERVICEFSDDRGAIMLDKIENPPLKIRITIVESAKTPNPLGYFYIYLKDSKEIKN
jgi:hypothetical protein